MLWCSPLRFLYLYIFYNRVKLIKNRQLLLFTKNRHRSWRIVLSWLRQHLIIIKTINIAFFYFSLSTYSLIISGAVTFFCFLFSCRLTIENMFGTRHKTENNAHGSSAEYRKIALVIGNSLYHRNSKLNNTVNDANGMCDTLKSIGFEVSKGLNLTHSQMQSYINNFVDNIQPNDLALFYFAGHGTQ